MIDMKSELLEGGPMPLVIQEFLAAQLYDSVILMVAYIVCMFLSGYIFYWLLKLKDESPLAVIAVLSTIFCLGMTISEAIKSNEIINSPRSYAAEKFPFN